MKKREKLRALALVAVVAAVSLLQFVQCQNADDDYSDQIDNPAVLHYLTQVVYSRLSNATSTVLTGEISSQLKFCIKDPYASFFPFFI